MGLHIHVDAAHDTAILYCSTTNWAFGPVFDSPEQAEAFIEYCSQIQSHRDPRRFTDFELKETYLTFIKEKDAESR